MTIALVRNCNIHRNLKANKPYSGMEEAWASVRRWGLSRVSNYELPGAGVASDRDVTNTGTV